MMKGEDIKSLIPQRYPMMMVEEFEPRDDQSAVTRLTVRPDNYFLLPGDEMAETGVIEHIAQSCSALAGYQALQQGCDNPPVGMIAEVKKFSCNRRPRKGEQIETTVTFGFTFGQMTLAQGTSCIDGETIAQVNLKIFVQ